MVGHNRAAITAYELALSLIAGRDAARELLVRALLAERLALHGETDAARDTLAQGRALAATVTDPRVRRRLDGVRALLGQMGVEVSEVGGEPASAAHAARRMTVAWTAFIAGDLRTARETLADAAVGRPQAASAALVWAALTTASLAALAGDYDEAVDTIRRWLPDSPDATSEVIAGTAMYEVQLRRGQLAAARATADRCWELAQTSGDPIRLVSALNALGRTRLDQGLDQVRAHFRACVDVAAEGAWYLSWAFAADWARALAAVGAVAELEQWLASTRPLLGRSPQHVLNRAALDTCEGLLAAARGTVEAATARLEAAVTALASQPLPAYEADARLDLARALLGAGERPDAVEPARAALTIAEGLGCPLLAAEARRCLLAAGVRVRSGRAPSATPGGLSAREIEVIVLVAQGYTNADIARRLFISPATVRNHISAALGKLGLSRRTEIARWVVEQRLLDRRHDV